jgi:hypothetical protein
MRIMIVRYSVAFVLSLVVLWCADAQDFANTASRPPHAERCSDECCFASSMILDGTVLSLRGLSTFRYWGLRVYTAGLYAPQGAQSRDALRGEIHKKLVICYHRSLSPDQFRDKSQEVLQENPDIHLNSLEPHLSTINRSYVSVKEGDRYAITYNPSSGVMKLVFNEKEPALTTIKSPAFARAYFGIWISEHSVGEDFTAELLGDKRGE